MKFMKKKIVLLTLLAFPLLVGCNSKSGGGNQGGEGGSGGGDEPVVKEEIKVYFYLDYNQKPIGNVYHTCKVEKGGLITDIPDDPTEPLYPEFPRFLGWSTKDLIMNEDDLWDFTVDRVNVKTNSIDLFGFWAAQGD